jgi:hypothetical protein
MIKKHLPVISFIMSFIALWMIYNNRSYEMGTVDTHAIIAMRSQELARKKITSKEIKNEVNTIKKVITEFGKKNHLILFVKGAIFKSDLKDYTDDIVSLLVKS